MDKTLFVEVGRALYGDRFQSQLARDLGISDRTMRRWVAGSESPPDGVLGELRKLVRERRDTLARLQHRLDSGS